MNKHYDKEKKLKEGGIRNTKANSKSICEINPQSHGETNVNRNINDSLRKSTEMAKQVIEKNNLYKLKNVYSTDLSRAKELIHNFD